MESEGILALDVALTVGFAYGHKEMDAPDWGVWVLPGHICRGAAIAALEEKLEEFIEAQQPALIAYEAPLPPNLQTDASSAFILLSLAGAVEASASRYGVRVISRSSTTYRTAVIGRARLTDEEKRLRHPRLSVKTAIVAPWVKAQGWDISDHNAADAAVVWAYEVGRRHPGFGRRGASAAAAPARLI